MSLTASSRGAGISTGRLRGRSLKKLDAQIARDVVDGAHAAWSNGDIERVLSFYTDNLVYWCNAGSIEGTPYVIEGKPAFRTFLHTIHAVAESGSVTEYFHFGDGVARASIEGYILHRRTGLVLSGSFRQVLTFRGRKIARLEDYHDAAKMAAFWRLVSCEETGQMAEEELN